MSSTLGVRTCVLVAIAAVLVCGADDAPLLKAKIEFDKSDGKEAFRLDPEGTEVELQTAKGKRLATYARKGSGVSIDLPKLGATGSVVVAEDRERYTLKDKSGAVKWILLREPDADWRLTHADEKLVIKLKLRDDGYKLVDAEDHEKGRVRVKEERVSIRNEKGTEVLRTKDTRSALAAACFQLEGLSMPEKGALALAIVSWPAKVKP